MIYLTSTYVDVTRECLDLCSLSLPGNPVTSSIYVL